MATQTADSPDDDNSAGGEVLPLTRPVSGDRHVRYSLDPPHRSLYLSGDALGWCPEVLEHLVRLDDAGEPVERSYLVSTEPGGAPVTLTTSALVSGDAWRDRAPRATGIGRRRVREALYDVVLEQAANLPPTWMVRATGWHHLPGGTWHYVRADDRAGTPARAIGIPPPIAAAARPVRAPEPGEVTQALAAIAGHGWGPILGLATGIRALAWSLVPVRSTLVATGEPNSGKTLTASMATAVVMTPKAWPPPVDASFSDTLTALERKIGAAGDRAVILDDMPLTATSGAAATRDAGDKFDKLVRAHANAQAIRDRATRDLELREGTYTRGLPVITAQRLPADVQASALRRLVLAHFAAGDNDTQWYAAHAAGLAPALRAIGDQVIGHLAALGPEAAAEWVGNCDQLGRWFVDQHAHDAVTPSAPGMRGVLDAAGQMIGGLVMAYDACPEAENVDQLVDAVLPPLAESLRAQADRIADRQAQDTGAGEALGDILRAALYGRRAHVRAADEDVPAAVVPGQTRQAQGLRDPDAGGAVAEGPGLYWLADRDALGVSSVDLHTIVTTSRDPRLAGFTVRSLPPFLLREGATIPGRQAGTKATEKVWTGRGAERAQRRLVLVPARLVFDLTGEDSSGEGTEAPGTGPTVPMPPATPRGARPPAAPTASTHTQERPDMATTPSPAPPARVPAQPEPAGPAPSPAKTGRRAAPTARRRPEAKPRAAVVAVESGHLVTGDGGRHPLGDDAAGDLCGLVAQAAGIVPAGDLTIVIGEDAHKGLGLPAAAPRDVKRRPKAFAALHAAGWYRPHHPGEAPVVTRTAAMAHPDRTGTVRLVPAAWLRADDWPRWRPGPEGTDDAGAVELAQRIARFEQVTGWSFEGTIPATSLRALRDSIEATATRRRRPMWQAGSAQWPTPHTASTWSRDLTDDDRAGGYIHRWDAVRNYLSAYRQAIIAGDTLAWSSDRDYDDPKRAGYWRIVVPEGPDRRLPSPVVGVTPGADAWVTTAVLALYDEAGIHPEVLESWTAPAVEYGGVRDWVTHLRDLLARADVDGPTRAALKQAYQTGHGKLRDGGRQGVIRRPDWGHAVRDAAWCGIVRKTWQAGGVLPLPARVTGGTRQRTERPMWPVAINHDEVAYPGGPEAVPPDGIEVGDGLGRFHPAVTVSVDEWEGQR